jgi:hypothetical protein
VIHTYQFLRLYTLHKYHTNQQLPKIDDKFIEHIIKTIAIGYKRGKKLNNDELSFFMKIITNKPYKVKNYLIPNMVIQLVILLLLF